MYSIILGFCFQIRHLILKWLLNRALQRVKHEFWQDKREVSSVIIHILLSDTFTHYRACLYKSLPILYTGVLFGDVRQPVVRSCIMPQCYHPHYD